MAPRWANFVPKMANLVPLWRLPAPRSAPDANRSEVSGEVKAKIGPSWAKLRPVVFKMVQVRAKMALFWHMGWIAENLKKPMENIGFLVFWGA